MRIFGREPAVVVGFLGALFTALSASPIGDALGLSAGAVAALTTFVSAVIIAATTRPVAPALFTGIVAAAAALLAEYRLDVSDEVVASVSALILAGFALFTRAQVTPNADPRPTAVV